MVRRCDLVKPDSPSSRNVDFIAVVFAVVATGLLFRNAWFDPLRTLQEDIALQMEGLHAAANEQIWKGELPHWNPYALGGERLFANIHVALLYPGTLLFRIFPFAQACVWTWFLHYVATTLATYAFARIVLGVNALAGLIAGIVFAHGGFCLGHCNHLNFVFALPYLPLSLLACHQFMVGSARRPGRWWLAGVAALCCLILSGGTPVLLLTLIAFGWLVCCLLLWTIRDRGLKFWAGRTAGLAAMGVIALGLTAVQLWPTLDLYGESARSTWSGKGLVVGIAWQTLVSQLLAPGVLGNLHTGHWGGAGHETLVFVGGVGLTSAVMGTLSLRRCPWIVPVILLAGVSVVLALGDNVLAQGLSTVFGGVKLRQPSRFVGLLQFALALMAAIGVHQWSCGGQRKVRRVEWAACLLTFALMLTTTLCVCLAIGKASTTPSAFAEWLGERPEAVRSWLAASSVAAISRCTYNPPGPLVLSYVVWCSAGLVILGCTWLKAAYRRKVAVIGICAWCTWEFVLFSAGTWAGQGRFPGVSRAPTRIVQFLKDNLGDMRYYDQAMYMPLWEHRGAVHGLSNVDGYVGSGLNISREHDALFSRALSRLPILSMFSTKYLIASAFRSPGELEPVFRDSGFAILQNPLCLARATLPEAVVAVPDADTAIERVSLPSFDPARMAFVTASSQEIREYSIPLEPDDQCEVTRWEPGNIVVDVKCWTPRTVMVSASYDEGWRAEIDGAPTTLFRTNGCLMSAVVPTGRHVLRMTYVTPGLRNGAAVSCATLLLVVAALYVRRVWERRRESDSGRLSPLPGLSGKRRHRERRSRDCRRGLRDPSRYSSRG